MAHGTLAKGSRLLRAEDSLPVPAMANAAFVPERIRQSDWWLMMAGPLTCLLFITLGYSAIRFVAWGWAWNPLGFFTLLVGGVAVAGIVHEAGRQARRQRRFEAEQRAKGLRSFRLPNGVVKWGLPEEVEAWHAEQAEAAARQRFENRLVASLERYEPSIGHDSELPYHMELLGWLRAEFPAAKPEVQRGASRPDIVVGNYAIEVKGPTGVDALRSVADKCMRYGQHFDRVIVVLFDVRTSDNFYAEWRNALLRTFPGTIVIRKAAPSPPPGRRRFG